MLNTFSFARTLSIARSVAIGAIFAFITFFAFGISPASAAVIESGPPFDAFFSMPNATTTIGGGAVMPLVQFTLSQSSGSDKLDKVGVLIVATSSMTRGEISRLSLWKESGGHPGFQIAEDTFLAGAASTSPSADNTLIVLDSDSAADVTITSTPIQFYVVASTTGISGITNGHGFNLRMQTNYASTTGGGVGTAFDSNKRIGLSQSATLKISEVKIGSATSVSDEFVELYNTGDSDVNLADMPLSLHSFYSTGSSTPGITLNYYKKTIPSHGYFLIGSQVGYSGSAPLDAVFSTSTLNILLANGGISIATSSPGNFATSSAIDYLGWGTQGTGNCENSGTTGTACSTLAEDGTSLERIAQGGPATSTAATMVQGGVDGAKGNGADINDNSAEFVAQTTPNPQNSNSPVEFPFGGGQQDTSTFQVQGSFPGNGMTGAPTDMTFIGFNFNKAVSTTTIISSSATTTVTLTTGGGSNLCSSVTYNPFPSNFEPSAKCNLSANLTAGTSYTFTVSTVYDLSSNRLDQDGFAAGNQNYTATFTTGSSGQSTTYVVPPSVIGVTPFSNSSNIPTNLSKITIEFNQAGMDTTTLTNSNITLSATSSLTLSSFSLSTSTGKNILTASVNGTLPANTEYTVTIGTGVKTAAPASIALPVAYTSKFKTGTGADTSAPAIVGVIPTPSTTITAGTSDFVFSFDDSIDTTTATSGSVTLGISGGANLPGSVRYDPVAKEGHFTPTNVLPVGQTLVLTLKAGSIKNVSGTALTSDVTRSWTVESTNSDTTAPSILFVNSDEFNIAITFNEGVNSTDATTLDNYTVTVGGTAQTLSALAGHSLTYDATTRTAKLSGLRIPSAAAVVVSASNIKDLSGNLAGTVSGTCTSSASTGTGGTGGFIGPGSFDGSTFGDMKDFSSAGIGFMPPVNIRPSSTFVNASSTYAFELPISKQIDASGTIVITFPSSSDFGLCCAATTSSANPFLATQNEDINGPGPSGSDANTKTGIKTITKDSTAKTITLTLDNPTRSQNSDVHDFLHFSIAGIKNPSIPKGIDSSGYSIDIKSKSSAGALLETFNANPVYIGGGSIGGGATTTIRGTVSGNGSNLSGVSIHLMSPQTGPQDATTNTSGVYTFSDIPVNSQFLSNNFGGGSDFMLFTDPLISGGISDENGATTTAFFGNMMPTPVQATSTSIITRNFAFTNASAGTTFTVRLTAAANAFSGTNEVDVFAGGPGQFVVKTVPVGTAATTSAVLTSIQIPQTNGSWGVGIGPAMPKAGSGGFTGVMSNPNWSIPKPIEVVVSGCPSACSTSVSRTATTTGYLTISAADKTITGTLKDGSGNSIANAMVFAYSPTNGNGSNAQTSTAGTFTLKVTTGSYVVGAFSPGMGKSKEVTVVVDSSGNIFVDGSPTATTAFVLKMTKPSYTITGQVTDGSSAVGNAPVFAYRTDAPGHVDAVSDSSTGNYTLYVDNGTWKVNSFIPGFGPMTEQTVTISGASQSNINFAPSSGSTFSLYTGTIFDDADNNTIFATSTEGIVGAVIRLSGSSGVNEGVSGADGAFSIRVPSGSGYTITDIFHPSYGRIAPLDGAGNAIGTLNLTASSTGKYIRVPKRNSVVVNIKDSNGNFLLTNKAFIDFFATSTKQGTHAEITNATSTSFSVATGTSATIRVYIQGVSPKNISVASDDGATVIGTGGVLTVDSATETVKVVVNTTAAAMSTIYGTVYKTSETSGNELEDAWIQFVDETNGVHFGTQATSSGKYNLKAADGSYTVLVSKPGYVGSPATVTISGTTTKNFVLDTSSLTISGTVTAGGSAAKNAFVRATKSGGGEAITQTDTSGAFTLNVTSGTWRVFATAEGYAQGAASANPITVTSSQTGVTVALSTALSVQSKLATSNTFTDTSAGTFSDSTVGVSVDLDSNTLGSAGNDSYMTAQETTNIPDTASVNIVGSKAKDINAFSGDLQVKNLAAGKEADVTLTYTKAELIAAGYTSTSSVANLTMISYSEDKKEWESLSTVATYKDSSGNVLPSTSAQTSTSNGAFSSSVSTIDFTAVGSHFSAYALSGPEGTSPPNTPSGVTATAGATASGQITVGWSSVTDATGYFIYRDTSSGGSFPLLVDAGNVTSYLNTGVTNGTTYYYKVSAYKSSGTSESGASSAVSATVAVGGGGGVTPAPSGGGGSAVTSTYIPSEPVPISTTPKTTPAPTTTGGTETKVTVTTPGGATPTVAAIAALKSAAFNRPLTLGSKGADVIALQSFLEAKGHLKMPAGVAKGYFGVTTKTALVKYQQSVGLPTIGVFGPGTTAKVKAEISASVSVPAGSAPAIQTSSTLATSVTLAKGIKIGTRSTDVKLIQQVLNSDAETQITASGAGSPGQETETFGSLTLKAVQKFQVKYGISGPGDEGYGVIGPKTRAKFEMMISGGVSASAPAGAPSSSVSATVSSEVSAEAKKAALTKQIEDAMKMIEKLQSQLVR